MLDHHFYQRTDNLTGLLLPLVDRNLILPNVAVAELIDYQPGRSTSIRHRGTWGWWRGGIGRFRCSALSRRVGIKW